MNNPMRWAITALALWALVACRSGDDLDDGKNNFQAAQAQAVETPYAARVQAAIELGYADAGPAADRELTRVIDDPAFAQLPAARRREVLSLAAYAANGLEEFDRAKHLVSAAIQLDRTTREDWLLLSWIEGRLDNPEVAAQHLAHVMREWPARLDELDVSTFFGTMYAAAPDSPARLALLEIAFDAKWAPKDVDMSEAWYELTLLLSTRGELHRAATVVDRIDDPIVLAKIRSDKRFDTFVAADPAGFDVEGAAARQLRHLRERSAATPLDLDLMTRLFSTLIIMGELQEVLERTVVLLARTAGDPTQVEGVTGLDQLSWIHDMRASALARLGRFDDALAQMELASRLDEGGVGNVSQVLNLAGYYAQMNRPQEALSSLAKVGRPSRYGRMVQESIRFSASTAIGDEAGANAALSHLRAHAEDAPLVLIGALVQTDRMDEAAALLVSALASTHQRGGVLLALQDFRMPPLLPASAALQPKWRALINRPDVRKAIDEVGRIRSYAIYYH